MLAPDLRPLSKLNPTKEWAAWKPTEKDPFSAKWAAHLYRRAGFGCTPAELKEAVANGLDKTLEKMWAPAKTPFKPLPSIERPPMPVDPNNPVPQPVANPNFVAGAIQIRANWLLRMLSGAEPIRERLTFFWHNHFATSIAKIQDAKLMQRQNDLIRQHALGKFGPFLREMSRDASMLIWLDSNQNVKAHPNENYAREIMELFSLGVGNYTEKDVQEAARAFTGWHVTSGSDGERNFIFQRSEHDFGTKTLLGQTGDWDGDDIIRIILEQKCCAQFLVRKLYRFLISENEVPPNSLIEPLCDDLRKSDYDISVVVRKMLKSRHFFSAYAYRQIVKSPIDYVLGVARMLGTGPSGSMIMTPYQLIGTLELQGQQLYSPPNVKGWEGGKAWLNTATVLARHNFGAAIANGMKELNEESLKITGARFAVSPDPLPFILRRIRDAKKLDNDELPESIDVVQELATLLVPGDLRPEVVSKLIGFLEKGSDSNEFLERCRGVLLALVTLPEYQLG